MRDWAEEIVAQLNLPIDGFAAYKICKALRKVRADALEEAAAVADEQMTGGSACNEIWRLREEKP